MSFHPDEAPHSEWPARIAAIALAMAGATILVATHMIYGVV